MVKSSLGRVWTGSSLCHVCLDTSGTFWHAIGSPFQFRDTANKLVCRKKILIARMTNH